MQICTTVSSGSMAEWLAHLEFELGDPGSIPGSRHYSIGKLFTHIAFPVSLLQVIRVQKEFSAREWLW